MTPLETVAAGLAQRKLDAMLISVGPNIRYLTGFTGDNAALLVLPGRSILFTDPRFEIQAAQETASAGCRIKISRGPLMTDVVAAVKRAGVRRIGYEPARMLCDSFEFFKSKLPMRASLEPARGWIEELRMIKSPEELQRIRRSVETNSKAFEQAVARVRPGMKEADLAAELEYRMRRVI